MPKIIETIVTTSNEAGDVHVAPLGLIVDGDDFVIAPFKPSRTLDNLRVNPFACASHTDDVRLFAGGVTGRKAWPLVPLRNGRGARLSNCISHHELAVTKVIEDEVRPRFLCRVETHEQHRPWHGWNRAQAAVIEGAILVSRLHMLPAEKVEREWTYLEIAISKTAGPQEDEAWRWLLERVEDWRRTSREGVAAR